MLALPLSIAGYVLMFLACAMAAASGDRAARAAAGVVVFGWFASTAAQNYLNLTDPQWALTGVDLVLLVVFALMALRWRRWWLAWMAAFQLLIVATDTAFAIDRRIEVLAYYTAYYIWSYLLLAALAAGGFNERAKRRRVAEAGEEDISGPAV